MRTAPPTILNLWLAIGLLSGSVLTAGVIYGVGAATGRLPVSAVSAVGLVTLCWVSATGQPLRFRGYTIPREWARLGRSLYVFAFGLLLGAGFLTATASSGFWALVVWAGSPSAFLPAWIPFLSFAAGRFIPAALQQGVAAARGQTPEYHWQATAAASACAAALELCLLGFIVAIAA